MIEYDKALGDLSRYRVFEERTRFFLPEEFYEAGSLRNLKGFVGAKTIINFTQEVLSKDGTEYDSFSLVTLPVSPDLNWGWWIRFEDKNFPSKTIKLGRPLDTLSELEVLRWQGEGTKLHFGSLLRLNLAYGLSSKIDFETFFDFKKN